MQKSTLFRSRNLWQVLRIHGIVARRSLNPANNSQLSSPALAEAAEAESGVKGP